MRPRQEHLYYCLAIIGLTATWYFNLQYFAHGGSVAPGPFFASAFANALAAAITVDVYWAALVFSVWTVHERRDGSALTPWPYIALCFSVGLAFAFPLYLARRARVPSRMDRRVVPGSATGHDPLRGTR
jgi:hypothetical protein